MKRLFALCLAVLSLAVLSQPIGTQTSPNLVYTNLNPYQGPAGSTSPGTWSGFVNTESGGGGLSGGNVPAYNSALGQFMFGYQQGTVAYRYAVSQALQSSGMTWLGYNYSWEYYNQELSRGTLSAAVDFAATNGTLLHSKTWSLGATTNGWTKVQGTETFTNALAVANIASFGLSFTGKDDRFWAGYYGPQVRSPAISVLYTFDQCYSNPLSSPDCPGYAQAYHDQQCAANPLYMSDCPGYQQAYFTQQCAANPLYAVTCPGYQQAYFTQQCSLNALYSTDCPGYSAAYKTQQCNLNALYSTDCPGYAAALKTQQCTDNPLTYTDCPGYQTAYFNQQCLKDSLYDKKCEGYATAYAIKYLVNLDPAVTTAVNQQLTATQETYKNDPARVTVVSSTVDSVLTAPSTTSVSPASVTSVLNQPQPAPGTSPVAGAAAAAAAPPPPPAGQQQERQADQKKTDGAVAGAERRAGGDRKEAGRQVAAAAKDAAEKAQRAATMEAQAATQGLVVGLMGYVPGFSAYQNAIVPDTLSQQLAKQYMKPTVDNRAAQRALTGASDNLHRRMVDAQWELGQ